MGAPVLQAYVTRPTLFAFCILGICMTASILVLRVYIRIRKQHRLYADDYFLFFSVVAYWILAVLYIVDLPHAYAFFDFLAGKKAIPLPELQKQYHDLLMISFAVTALFWGVLWSVKFSLLLFFRRVIKRTEWMKAWWAVLTVTFLLLLGCVTSELTSCRTIADFTILGACASARDQKAQIISLYFSFAADVVTEVAVLALPLRVISKLQMSARDKVGLACLFSVGLVSIAFSFIRVFAIWAKTGSTSPSPAWLALWALIQGMVVIMVGCIPAISQVFRQSEESKKRNSSSYYANSYIDGKPSYVVSSAATRKASAVNEEHDLVPITSASRDQLDSGQNSIQCKREIKVTSEAADGKVEMPQVRFGMHSTNQSSSQFTEGSVSSVQ